LYPHNIELNENPIQKVIYVNVKINNDKKTGVSLNVTAAKAKMHGMIQWMRMRSLKT